jgi:basic membrane protein A
MRPAPLFALALSGCWLGPWPGADMTNPSVGFIYRGTVDDHEWTRAHDDGRRYLEEYEPSVTTHGESSVGVEDAATVLDRFVAIEDSLIITTGSELRAATLEASERHEQVNFLGFGGSTSSDRMGSFSGRIYQAWYLAGMVAGGMSAQSGSDRVGVVGPVATPDTVRWLNALTLGAQATNPEVTVQIEWTDTWFDAELELLALELLRADGADVIATMTDTRIVPEAVHERYRDGEAVWSIGHGSLDTCELVGKSCLTAPAWNWGPLYARLLEQMMVFRWDPSELVWDQMLEEPEESTVQLAALSAEVPEALQVQVEDQRVKLSKPWNVARPFEGPLLDGAGTLVLDEEQALSDQELLSMCWLVQGVVDAEGLPSTVPDSCTEAGAE